MSNNLDLIPEHPHCLYTYQAEYVRNWDGDTVTLDVDLGMKIWQRNLTLRLSRIDAVEKKGETIEAGRAAQDFVAVRLKDSEIVLRTVSDKKGKYGRWLGEIWYKIPGKGWTNLNDELVSAGHAKRYKKG